VAEVLVDGRWYYAENSCRHAKTEDLEAFFPAGFMEVTLDPAAYGPFAASRHQESFWRRPNGQYHFMGGTWQCPATLRFAASNAHALYPYLERWGFKADYGNMLMPLVLRRNGFYWVNGEPRTDPQAARARRQQRYPFPLPADCTSSDYLYHPFRPGDRIRQSVWLGEIADMQGLEVQLPFAPEPHVQFTEQLGRQLTVKVGDFERSLADLGAWPPKAEERRPHLVCAVRIPNDALKANAVNWIELRQNSGLTMQAPYIPAAMEPYIHPLWTESPKQG
jgi:hypothetical protein